MILATEQLLLSWRHPRGLAELDHDFLQYCQSKQPQAFDFLVSYRDGTEFPSIILSENLITIAKLFSTFIATKLNLQSTLQNFQQDAHKFDLIYSFKEQLVIKEARAWLRHNKLTASFNELNAWLQQQVALDEYAVAEKYFAWQEQENKEDISKLAEWSLLARENLNWSSLQVTEKVDFNSYFAVDLETADEGYSFTLTTSYKPRDGFALTDSGMNHAQIAHQVRYCIYCHDKEGDFCSIGFPQKKGKPELGFKANPLGVELKGCPLEQKISESHLLQKQGDTLAALLMIMRDNPLCILTGSRICNDCMQSCIYQKKEPVNIPQIETRIVKDILHLPWGLELYDLMLRYNPLKQLDYIQQENTNKNIMVVGMGAAGMTAAHYLTLQGHNVVGVDGIKIEKLPTYLVNECVESIDTWLQQFPQQDNYGFGGVSAYGITARWNKVFLKIAYALLLRRANFRVYGNMRFGGAIRLNDLWPMGFDHAVVAVGAGLPRALNLENSLAPGMLQANDFLMNLHLNNAASMQAIMSTDIVMPICVIGGGLTAVDAATEVQAYYIRLVERVYQRYQNLINKDNFVREQLTAEQQARLAIYLEHGAKIAAERKAATVENRKINFIPLLHKWGGVSIVYRRRMQDSPAYRLNFYELKCAMEEGIKYVAMQSPDKVICDEYGRVKALRTRAYAFVQDKLEQTEDFYNIPAATIITATGATPNVAYAFEHKGELLKKQGRYQAYDLEGEELVADKEQGMFTSYENGLNRVTFIGDVNPSFQGSVVKAIASAKQVIPDIKKALALLPTKHETNLLVNLDQLMAIKVAAVETFASFIKLTVHAPQIAKMHKPAAFYRIQVNTCDDSFGYFQEPYVAIGCNSKDAECLDFFIHSDELFYQHAQQLQSGMPLSIMGPTGVACKPVGDKTIWVIGKLDAARYALALASAGKLDSAGKVVYVATTNNMSTLYPQLQQYNVEIITIDSEDPQTIVNNLYTTMPEAAEIFIIENACLAKKLYIEFKHGEMQEVISTNSILRVATLAPMQCMLKGVCAKCLQWQVDPATGERTKAVYACSWQLQPAELVDFSHLASRQNQDSIDLLIGKLWLETQS